MRDAFLMDDGVAPRSRFSSFSPVFPVRDLRRALAHYASLGFEVQPYADGDEYGFAERDEVSLHLSLDEGHGPEADHQHVGTAYLYVGDADALYDEWARPGVGGLTHRVGDRPYKLREGSHVDPDGNLIRFGSPMPGRPGERLRAHLETRYGITVDAMTELDLGVWRVGRADGPDWVARWFPARRPAEAVAGDAAILRYLAAHEFPAERCAADEPVSVLDGRSVLVTEWADPVPRPQRRDAIRAAGGLSHLGALLGRLHTLDTMPAASAGSVGVGAAARPGGAWHHLADGLPSAEVAAASRMLAEAAPLIPDAERAGVRRAPGGGRRAGCGGGTARGAHPPGLRPGERRRDAGRHGPRRLGRHRPRAAPVVAGVPPVRGGREGAAPGGCGAAWLPRARHAGSGGTRPPGGGRPGPPPHPPRLVGVHGTDNADGGHDRRVGDEGPDRDDRGPGPRSGNGPLISCWSPHVTMATAGDDPPPVCVKI